MNNMSLGYPMHASIIITNEDQLRAVYAVLANPNIADAVLMKNELARQAATGNVGTAVVKQATEVDALIPTTEMTITTISSANSSTEVDDGAPDLDAHGWPWSAELHASTKGTTKEGLWRMKPGATRPAPKSGFPKDTGTEAETASTSASASPVTQAEPVHAVTTEEDDEFAAFRAAAAKTDAEDATAKASVPARKWTDADLGALCNQAAVKLGDPLPVKAIIAEYVTEGETPHSRNIPEDMRAEFAAAIEAKAGIEFAG